MLIDTHAHVNFKAFAEDVDQTIGRALEAGVWVVNVGTQIDTSRQAVDLAEKYPPYPSSPSRGEERGRGGVYAVIGLHPVHTYSQHLDEEETSFLSREEKFDFEAYRKLADSPKVVGIGECGLDYYRLPQDDGLLAGQEDRHQEIKKLQKDAFVQQIRLAKEANKALVIHCRPSAGSQDAYEDILQILDQEAHLSLTPSPYEGREGEGLRFEIHSFTGSPGIVQEFIKRGAYVGLNGIITFDKSGNMEEVVKTVPIDRIVLETDSPYLTPVPHRGKRNEPLYVKHVAERVAKIKNLSLEEVEKITTENAKKLFALSK